MTYLDCSVTGCIYNDDRCCCKGSIEVEGREAQREDDTCCGSFKECREGCACNAIQEKAKETDVSCEAVRCVFNQNLKCSAEHIGIAGGNACTCQGTKCASFECGCA